MHIRPLQKSDYPQWLPLWEENCLNQVSQKATSKTWQWITDDNEPVGGLGLFDGDTLIGIVHYILHKSTANLTPAALMQDLFIHPDHRGKSYAKRMVTELANLATQNKWCRLYWLADGTNEVAQRLYKKIGVTLNFTMHAYPLSP